MASLIYELLVPVSDSLRCHSSSGPLDPQDPVLVVLSAHLNPCIRIWTEYMRQLGHTVHSRHPTS